MRYPYEQKKGWALLGFGTATFALVFIWTGQEQFWGRGGTGELWLLPALYLLLAGLIWHKHLLLRAVRTDEEGMTVERRGLKDLHVRWRELTVSHRARQRRGAEGLFLEKGRSQASGQAEEPEPFFLPLEGLGEPAELLREMERRLGTRFTAEGEVPDGESQL